ncbi:MAG: thioredoxin family protein [Dehalococcoidia bacterium]|nr:thioredoxin family protein [Dehalococcoidia bacterium]
MDELVRLAVAVVLAATLLAAVIAARSVYRRRLSGHVATAAGDLVSRFALPPGEPAILYLSGERCVQCVALQEPALRRLAEWRSIIVHKIDAAAATDITRRFNILTVPSTVVIGPDHRIRGVNVGFADEDTLRRQLT